MINDDITVEKPIDDYYAELDKRLQGLKSELGTDADWMPSTYEKYMTGQHQVAGSLQRNVREYYNDFKLLRADTQVRVAYLYVFAAVGNSVRCDGCGDRRSRSRRVRRSGQTGISPLQRRAAGSGPRHRTHHAPPLLHRRSLPCPEQVYYPVPNEVYRDEWDDVQVGGWHDKWAGELGGAKDTQPMGGLHLAEPTTYPPSASHPVARRLVCDAPLQCPAS